MLFEVHVLYADVQYAVRNETGRVPCVLVRPFEGCAIRSPMMHVVGVSCGSLVFAGFDRILSPYSAVGAGNHCRDAWVSFGTAPLLSPFLALTSTPAR